MKPDLPHSSPVLSRRALMRLSGATAVSIGAAGLQWSHRALAANPSPRPASSRDPDEILRGLLEGNKRFAAGQPTAPRRRPEDFAALAQGQTPAAVVVGCADSRVPVEITFDQGVGDMFVVRVAGNMVSNAGFVVKGSIEYAVLELGAPLIVVLGHSGCGAVKAALTHIAAKDALPGSLNALVSMLKPVVAKVKGKPGDPLDNAIRANVEAGVDRLRTLEPILAPAVKRQRLKVVGGVYDLSSGRVAML